MRTPKKRLEGVVPVLVTPFLEDETIDEASLRRMVDFAAELEVSAICLPAYASEFYKLSDEERLRVVKIAIEQGAGRVQVIAQSNHGSAMNALRLAQANVAAGADLISIAIPRQFAPSDEELLHYLKRVLGGVDVPCLVQDFNPGGPSIGAEFAQRLRGECRNFDYLKIEEPLCAAKIQVITEATRGEVGILEGWGGLYVMELTPAGICGLMPGLAMADSLQRVFKLRRQGEAQESFRLFERLLPQIEFSLQNMELFIYCEKRLLQERGLLQTSVCRAPCFRPDAPTRRYIDELTERTLRLLDEERTKAARG